MIGGGYNCGSFLVLLHLYNYFNWFFFSTLLFVLCVWVGYWTSGMLTLRLYPVCVCVWLWKLFPTTSVSHTLNVTRTIVWRRIETEMQLHRHNFLLLLILGTISFEECFHWTFVPTNICLFLLFEFGDTARSCSWENVIDAISCKLNFSLALTQFFTTFIVKNLPE